MLRVVILFGSLLVALIILQRLRILRRDSKYFAWLYRFLEWDLYLYVIGSAVFVLILIIGMAVNHFILRKKRTIEEMNIIKSELYVYYQVNNAYPESIVQLTKKSPLKQTWLQDAWKNDYTYIQHDKSFILCSSGLDGEFETDDDLVVSNK